MISEYHYRIRDTKLAFILCVTAERQKTWRVKPKKPSAESGLKTYRFAQQHKEGSESS